MGGLGDDDAEPELDSEDEALLREGARAPARTPVTGTRERTELRTGTAVGKYTLDRLLGQGGMGVVYVAEDPLLRRRVAIKLLPTSMVGDAERRARFVREAEAAAAATGPNIAAIYEAGEVGEHVYLVMELVAGTTLRARIAKGDLEVPEVVRIASGIARGLARAHAARVVHRDLKPDNVMIDESSEPKILDFGLAKRELPDNADTLSDDAALRSVSRELRTEEGKLLGTPAYMSPEQAKGKDVGARSDIFSFGVVLYEMLTGVRPFAGETTLDILVAIARDVPPPPSSRNARVPKALDELTLRCLDKDPDKRPTAAHVVDALSAAHDLRAPSPSRMRAIAAVLFAGAVLAAGVAIAGTRHRSIAASPPPSAPSAPAPAFKDEPWTIPDTASAVPGAVEAFRAGIAARRADNYGDADFERALTLDPHLAEAHVELVLSLYTGHMTTSVRDHASAAFADVHRLTPSYRAVLEAVEPIAMRTPSDWREAALRLRKLASERRRDARTWQLAAMTAGNADSELGAATLASARSELPDDLVLRGLEGELDAYLERRDRARVTLDECITLSGRRAIRCLVERADLAQDDGDCPLMEAHARQLVVVAPAAPIGYIRLASSLAGRAPVDAVRSALEPRWATLPEPRRSAVREADESNLAVLAGDFEGALTHARAAAVAIASNPWRPEHGGAALREARILLELGREDAAGSVAAAFLAKRTAWEQIVEADDTAVSRDTVPELLAIATRTGKMKQASFVEERDAWEADWYRRVVRGFESYVWLYGRAFPALHLGTKDAATDALAALSLDRVRRPPEVFDTLGQLAIGSIYLQASQLDDAKRWLSRATSSCRALVDPIDHVRSFDMLGRLHELRHDVASACTAYATVITRWGRASTTATHARARHTALGCPPPR